MRLSWFKTLKDTDDREAHARAEALFRHVYDDYASLAQGKPPAGPVQQSGCARTDNDYNLLDAIIKATKDSEHDDIGGQFASEPALILALESKIKHRL